jgi:uncharacterized protein
VGAEVSALGLGIGWRPQLAGAIAEREDLGFVELFAGALDPYALPREVLALKRRGVKIALHAIRLSLGGPDPLDARRLEELARLADLTGASVVSDHVCFHQAGGQNSGQLLPLPFDEVALEVLCENVSAAMKVLPVPLALENIASFVRFPGGTMDEPLFLSKLLEQTGASLLLDVANLHANSVNLGYDPVEWLDHAPLHRISYVHIAGGLVREGLYHDTHAHPLGAGPLALLTELRRRAYVPGVMLERDDAFPPKAELFAELDAIAGRS